MANNLTNRLAKIWRELNRLRHLIREVIRRVGSGYAGTSNTITYSDSPYTLLTEGVTLCDTTAGPIEVLLPAASLPLSQDGSPSIKNIGEEGNDVTVTPNGTDTIDEETTQAVPDGSCMKIMSDGAEWRII